MARFSRYDSGSLGTVTKTPQGGIVVDAYLTRTGVFAYAQPNGKTIYEYRPPEEVFHADSLATLQSAPVTNSHPSEAVNAANFGKYSVGHVDGAVKQDGDKVAAKLVIQRLDALRAVENKTRRQVSCGYNCDVSDTPGTAPDGSPYDRVQTNIRYNHVAIVEDGRAGPDVKLRLDSSGNQSEDSMNFELIEGVKYELDTDAHKAACERRDSANKARAEAEVVAKAELLALKTRLDHAEKALADAKTEAVAATAPARLDALAQVRNAVVTKATRDALGAEFKADGLSNAEIKKAAVIKAFPAVKLDDLDAAQAHVLVTRLFRAIPKLEGKPAAGSASPARMDASGKISGVPAALAAPPPGFQPGAEGGRTLAQIRADRDNDASRHRKSLAVSKDSPSKDLEGNASLQGSTLESMR